MRVFLTNVKNHEVPLTHHNFKYMDADTTTTSNMDVNIILGVILYICGIGCYNIFSDKIAVTICFKVVTWTFLLMGIKLLSILFQDKRFAMRSRRTPKRDLMRLRRTPKRDLMTPKRDLT